MVELIKIEHIDGERFVSARELHAFLQVGKFFANWIKDRIQKYDLQEGVDCLPILASKKEGRGGHNAIDYNISLDCAKELAMAENNPQGKRVRRYFIEVERTAKELWQQYSMATQYGTEQVNGEPVRYALVDGIKWICVRDLMRAGGSKRPNTRAYRDTPYSRNLELVGVRGAVCCVNEFGAKLIGIRSRSNNLQLSLFDTLSSSHT